MSDSLWPHGLNHVRLPCPSPSPGVCSNSCPLSRWCHPTISSSAVPFFFFLQSFPASGSFPMSWFFVSGGQSIRASASHRNSSFIPVPLRNLQGITNYAPSARSLIQPAEFTLMLQMAICPSWVGCTGHSGCVPLAVHPESGSYMADVHQRHGRC